MEFAIVDLMSHQNNLGMPKGKIIVDITASINWSVKVMEGIMSMAQVKNGA